MDDKLVTAFVGVITAVIGVSIIATLVSKNANTSQVLSAGATGFSQILNTALSPVSGNNFGGLSGGAGPNFSSLIH